MFFVLNIYYSHNNSNLVGRRPYSSLEKAEEAKKTLLQPFGNTYQGIIWRNPYGKETGVDDMSPFPIGTIIAVVRDGKDIRRKGIVGRFPVEKLREFVKTLGTGESACIETYIHNTAMPPLEFRKEWTRERAEDILNEGGC